MEVTVDWRCEAAAMDYASFENYSDPVVPCDEPARVEVVDYRLCEGCADALDSMNDSLGRAWIQGEEG